LVVGGVAGWFAKQLAATGSRVEARPDSEKAVFSYRLADADTLAPPPAWRTWEYPGSKLDNSSTGGHSTVGELEFGHTETIALTTSDDFDKVWTFYKEKCQLGALGRGGANFQASGNEKAIRVTLFDNVQANGFSGPKSDLLQARAFTVHSIRYQLVGFVYRPKASDTTCILLAYRPNTEFIALMKERVVKD
jgi:hypothetical protein